MNEASERELDHHAAVMALCDYFEPVAERLSIALDAAAERVLAVDLQSQTDLPSFSNSAMDGYAVRAADCNAGARLRVIGSALAGHAFGAAVTAGTTVRITTGAPLPAGADAVVMQEEATRDGDVVSLQTTVEPGLNVRPRGGHVHAGETVLAAGAVLRAEHVGLATAIGATRVDVFRPLRVGLASTGDELADPPATLELTGSYDANRPMLAVACHAMGFETLDLGLCRDTAADFAALLTRAHDASVDVLIVSGGSAMGDADVVRQARSVRFLPVNIRPGRGVTFGTFELRERRLRLLGLPGNAVAAFVMFHLIAVPALLHIAGARANGPAHLPLPLACELRCTEGLVDYRRGRLERNAPGDVVVRPLAQQGSAMLRTIVQAQVLIAAGPRTLYQAGEPILVVPLAALPG